MRATRAGRRVGAGVAVAVGLAVAAPVAVPVAAATADPPGTVQLTPASSALAPLVYGAAVAGDAYAYVAETVPGVTEMHYRAPGASAEAPPINVPGATLSNPTITGTTLTFASLDGTTSTELVHRVDMTSGHDTTYSLRLDNAKSELYVGATSAGFVIDAATSAADVLVLRQIVSGSATTDQTLATFPATGSSALTDVAAVDDAGVAYVVGTATQSAATDQLTYRSFGASATARKIGAPFDEDKGGISVVALTPHDLLWSGGTKILREPRTGGAVTSFTLPFGDDTVDSLAGTDASTAWVAENDSLSLGAGTATAATAKHAKARAAWVRAAYAAMDRRRADVRATQRRDAARSATTDDTVADADAGYVAKTDGSDRHVVAAKRFVATLAADATSADGSPVVAAIGYLAGDSTLSTADPTTGAVATLTTFPVPIAATISLALAQGRLAYSDTRTLDLSLLTRSLTRSGGTLTVGAEHGLTTSASPQAVQVSGDRIADIEFVGTAGTPELVFHRDGDVERRVLVASDFISYKLSGGYALLYGGVSTKLLDLSTGAVTTAPDNSDLWGQQLVWTDNKGALWRRDLSLPQSRHNPRKIRSAQCSAKLPGCVFGMVTWGDWATYTIFGATRIRTVLINMKSGHSYTVSKSNGSDGSIPALSEATPVLIDGAYVTDVNGTLEDIDLRHPTDVSGRLVLHRVADNLGQFAADEGIVGWVALDGTVRVAPLPNAAVTAPRLFSFPATGAFSPNGDGSRDTWHAEFDTTRPLSSATVDIRDRKGHLVRTLAAGVGAAEATVRTRWDGRDAGGRRMPDGTYTWSFIGTGPGGTAKRTGEVAIHRAVPHARPVALPLSTAVSAAPTFRVSWRAVTASTGAYHLTSYDVRYRKRVDGRHGWHWSVWHPWLTQSTRTSAKFAGTAGHTYYFSVRPHDNAGNTGRWSATRATTVPYDDRASGIRYSGGWTVLRHAHGRFRSTLHETSLAGKTLTYRQVGSLLTIVGERGPGGGSFRVYVDGRLVGVASAQAAHHRARAVLFRHALGRRLHAHTVRLVTAGSAGHPGVGIDGVAFTR